jgi:hypothetical protein
MGLSEGLLTELDAEMVSTRKTLERIPEDKLTWKPHEKSMGLDVANRPAGYKPLVAESQKHVLEIFDKNVAQMRAAIASASDADWAKTWTLSAGEKKIFSGARIGAVRRMMLNHMIHHRAQLGVYLRLNGVPVPSVYGPSADEGI